ncbi:MAG: hypothetical protein DWQ02_21220 [Bacteroidetes bacterium]|nr:MAG: hypothetical protein DWQ02_21220 [Bacteroidota bacterium]
MKKETKITSEFLNEILSEFKDGKIDYSVRNIVALKEIESAFKKKGNIIFNALKSLSKEKEWNLEKFEKHVKVAEDKIKKERRTNKFQFFVPVTYEIRKRSFTYLGNIFTTLSSNKIQESYGNDKFQHWNNASMRMNIHNRYPYICFNNQGKNFGLALDQFYPIFESLQGLINYCITAENFAMRFPFKWQEAEFSIRNAVFGIDKNGKKQYGDVIKLSRGLTAPTKTKKINDVALKNLNFTLNKLKEKPQKNSIDELLYSVFRLYYTACNSMNHHEAFLNFWQICESISFSQNFRGDTMTILKRISSFVSPKGLIGNQIDNTLKNLSTIRNDIVHRGIDNSDQEYLMILKYYVDRAIKWLFHNKTNLKTMNELEYYFQFKAAGNSNLKGMTNTIKFIESLRK